MPCAVSDCQRPRFRTEYCSPHYQRFKKYGDATAGGPMRQRTGDPMCKVDGCQSKRWSKGYCGHHYGRFKVYGDALREPPTKAKVACSVDGCTRFAISRGFCSPHYAKWHKHGDPLFVSTPQTRRKGKRRHGGDGYIRIYKPEHPNARSGGYIAEHTVVMTEALGRPMRKGESVHHRNGIRDDNRLENLELWASIPQPSGQRVSDLIAYANTIRERYGVDPTPFA